MVEKDAKRIKETEHGYRGWDVPKVHNVPEGRPTLDTIPIQPGER